jgi:hypothetical protein
MDSNREPFTLGCCIGPSQGHGSNLTDIDMAALGFTGNISETKGQKNKNSCNV